MCGREQKALSGLAVGTALAVTLGLLATGPAIAATRHGKPSVTPACSVNSYCSDPVFNVESGIQYFADNRVAGRKRGTAVDLSWADDNDPGEDWRVSLQAPVSVLYQLGYIGAAMELHYRSMPAVEVMWTPYGVTSNMCRGTAKAAAQGEKISLQPCGNFPDTLWVVDSNTQLADHADVVSPVYGGNVLIAGSTRNPSVPYVMTAGGLSGENPFAQLRTEQLTADDGVPDPAQLWCTATETLPDPSPSSTAGPAGPPAFAENSPCFPAVRINGRAG
jgi:hypothetical protein